MGFKDGEECVWERYKNKRNKDTAGMRWHRGEG